ncbi:hypothetical protein [Cytobacillus oceanisediminis]|uniref:hypothetical protein n=1 Tax=Cytobacillus oceanisediminis TaxID=665099 RepID=UPI001FB46CDF|nr:hypothetical protein [Cytobacillus oceanisediminis]UOE58064.1 hypothetical protein IRB79_27765 [Cytobacillus oceanisediminis]
MKKIDVIYKLLQVDEGYNNMLKPLASTKLEIFDIFEISLENPIRLFIGDMFTNEEIGSVYYENTSTYEASAEEVRDHILQFDDGLLNEATIEELGEVCMYLAEIDGDISFTCQHFKDLGVEFKLLEENRFAEHLLFELLKDDAVKKEFGKKVEASLAK